MSDTPPPESSGSSPPNGGWDEVAQDYKTWHPGLHGHVERLLAERGVPIQPGTEVSSENAGTPEQPEIDLESLKKDVAVSAVTIESENKFSGANKGVRGY